MGCIVDDGVEAGMMREHEVAKCGNHRQIPQVLWSESNAERVPRMQRQSPSRSMAFRKKANGDQWSVQIMVSPVGSTL